MHKNVLEKVEELLAKKDEAALRKELLSLSIFDAAKIINRPSENYYFGGFSLYAIIEACEFDRSFWDLAGYAAIITSIKEDHLDYYKNGMPEIINAFKHFIELTDKDGFIIVCKDDLNIRNYILDNKHEYITYGLLSGDWQAKITAERNSFNVYYKNKLYDKFILGVTGNHNVQNALAVIVLANQLGVPKKIIKKALKLYNGIHRRYEKKYLNESIITIDDYGHTPDQINSVIKNIRDDFPNHFLICICCLKQFHRTKNRLDEFASVFSKTDYCIVAPITKGLGDDDLSVKSITSIDLAYRINDFNCDALGFLDEKDVEKQIVNKILSMPNTRIVILTIGSGKSDSILESIYNRFILF